jgi:hypothetical protein
LQKSNRIRRKNAKKEKKKKEEEEWKKRVSDNGRGKEEIKKRGRFFNFVVFCN